MRLTELMELPTTRGLLDGGLRNPGMCEPLAFEDSWLDLDALRRHADLQQRLHHRYFRSVNAWADDLWRREVETGARPAAWWDEKARSYAERTRGNFEGRDPTGRSLWLPEVTVPRRAVAAPIVGTAFDYALRFGLASRYGREVGHTVAEGAVARLCRNPGWAEWHAAGRQRLAAALTVARTIGGEDLAPEQARACLHLAGLDPIWRADTVAGLLAEPHEPDVMLLAELYARVPWALFAPRRRLLLNPGFRSLPRGVSGADPDLVLDECLIDVKTAARPVVTAELLRQLVGYAVLAGDHGFDDDDAGEPVTRIGVYFARAGHLHLFNLDHVATGDTLARVRALLAGTGRTALRARGGVAGGSAPRPKNHPAHPR